MLIKNMDDELVIGSMGKVIGFGESLAGDAGTDKAGQSTSARGPTKSSAGVQHPIVAFPTRSGKIRELGDNVRFSSNLPSFIQLTGGRKTSRVRNYDDSEW